MYLEIYLYPILKENKEKFEEITQKAGSIYKEYGVIEDEFFTATYTKARFGCSGMADAVEIHEGEVLMLEISRYHDKQHHSQVLEKVNNDDRIEGLYDQVTNIIDVSRVVRGEFG